MEPLEASIQDPVILLFLIVLFLLGKAFSLSTLKGIELSNNVKTIRERAFYFRAKLH